MKIFDNPRRKYLILPALLIVVLGICLCYFRFGNKDTKNIQIPKEWVLFEGEKFTTDVVNPDGGYQDYVEIYKLDHLRSNEDVFAKIKAAKDSGTTDKSLDKYPRLYLKLADKNIKMYHRYDCFVEYKEQQKQEYLGELLQADDALTDFVLFKQQDKQIIRMSKKWGKYQAFYIVVGGKIYLARPLA